MNSPTDERPHLVLCQRRDGREREFGRYADPDEAERIAARLCEVGCAARVERLVEDGLSKK